MSFKNNIENYFYYFQYFYNYLGYRVFIALAISLLVGFFDGVGIALFIPLLKLILDSSSGAVISMSSNPDFVSDFLLNEIGIVPDLWNIFTLIIVFFGLKGLAKFFETYIRIYFQIYFIRKLRFTNIDLLNTFSYENFLKSDLGRIQNTFSGEVNRVLSAYIYYFKSIQFNVLVFVYLSFALWSDWVFALLVIAGGIITNLFFKILYTKTKDFSTVFTIESHKFQNLLIQKVHLFKYLKATGLNRIYSTKLKKNISTMEVLQLRLGFIDALLGAIKEPLTIMVVFIAILVKIYFLNASMGGVLISLLLLYRAITYFMAMQEQWNSFLGISGSIENMISFTNELNLGKEKDGYIQFDKFENCLELKNVSFKFNSEFYALKDISLKIRKNESVAIIGESGAGKTTLLNVISGLLVPSEGNFVVDNNNIKDIHLDSYKKQIGYIIQDVSIFNDTIFNNISFWAPKTEKNYSRFLAAIKKAAIYDYVMNLPNKEDSLLGSNGINISGGQKQRLSIARELYKDIDFLFMDEATSALDGETEAAVQANINMLKGHYTTIIIAHRLSTIKNVDKIILLKNGSVLKIGTFEELLSTSNYLQELVKLQNV